MVKWRCKPKAPPAIFITHWVHRVTWSSCQGEGKRAPSQAPWEGSEHISSQRGLYPVSIHWVCCISGPGVSKSFSCHRFRSPAEGRQRKGAWHFGLFSFVEKVIQAYRRWGVEWCPILANSKYSLLWSLNTKSRRVGGGRSDRELMRLVYFINNNNTGKIMWLWSCANPCLIWCSQLPIWQVLLLFPSHWCGNWGIEGLNNLPKVTQLVSGGAGVWT